MAHAHFRLGVWLRRAGRVAEAQRHLDEASRLHPDSWNIWRQAADLDEVGKASGPAFWARVQALGDRAYTCGPTWKGFRIDGGTMPRPHALTAGRMSKTILVVGAGFAGAVYARTLAERGWHIQVIDRRPHLAGNAYDEVDATGTRIHRYGPHLFHTNNERVVAWLLRFAPSSVTRSGPSRTAGRAPCPAANQPADDQRCIRRQSADPAAVQTS